MSTSPDDPEATYLPERYRQQVKAKKQRRLYKKLGTAVGVIVLFIVGYLLISGMLLAPLSSPPPANPVTPIPAMGVQTPAPGANVTAAVTPGYSIGSGISALHSKEVLPLDTAVSFIREEYPADTWTLVSVNLTDRYSGRTLYEFVILPGDRSSAETPFTVFEDAVTGDPFTRGQESARITQKQAQDLARKAFPEIQPELVRVRYSTSPDTVRAWNFMFVKGTSPLLTGSMDADTGLIPSFAYTIQKMGRPANPVLDMPAAQKIAKRYISDQNGPVAVNMSTGRYSPLGSPSDPVAGQYLFIFSRVVNDIPCDKDGFLVGVDAVKGEITAYERHWDSPDNAFSVTSEPLVLKREATFSALLRAKETYPESVSGLRIVSADIRWKDQHAYGVTPRLGSIPLAWKVTFDDDSIRANRSAQPAVAWVDAQTGSIIDFEYRH